MFFKRRVSITIWSFSSCFCACIISVIVTAWTKSLHDTRKFKTNITLTALFIRSLFWKSWFVRQTHTTLWFLSEYFICHCYTSWSHIISVFFYSLNNQWRILSWYSSSFFASSFIIIFSFNFSTFSSKIHHNFLY